MSATLVVGQLVRGRPFGKSKRVTGHVLWVQSGWIVHVELLPNRNGHTRLEMIDIANIEVLS
jgi:hypothetical protein